MDVCLLWVLCVVRSLQRAFHSSRGVLATVVRRWVWFGNFVNEENLAHWGAVAPKTSIYLTNKDNHSISSTTAY
jgi:hypothetical protein